MSYPTDSISPSKLHLRFHGLSEAHIHLRLSALTTTSCARVLAILPLYGYRDAHDIFRLIIASFCMRVLSGCSLNNTRTAMKLLCYCVSPDEQNLFLRPSASILSRVGGLIQRPISVGDFLVINLAGYLHNTGMKYWCDDNSRFDFSQPMSRSVSS